MLGGLEPLPTGRDPLQQGAVPEGRAVPGPSRDAPVSTWPLGIDELELAGEWLADEQNARWLDFGPGVRVVTPLMLKVMIQREQHCIWVYGPGEHTPAGLVGLANIQAVFRTAEIWYVLGRKEHARKGLTFRAACRLLEHGFADLDLHCVYAWTVDGNEASRRILERAGFRFAGRIRDRHRIGDIAHDRLWFDLLAHEYRLPTS